MSIFLNLPTLYFMFIGSIFQSNIQGNLVDLLTQPKPKSVRAIDALEGLNSVIRTNASSTSGMPQEMDVKTFNSISTDQSKVLIWVAGSSFTIKRNLLVDATSSKSGTTASLSFAFPSMEGATDQTKGDFSKVWTGNSKIVYVILHKLTKSMPSTADLVASVVNKPRDLGPSGLLKNMESTPYEKYFLTADANEGNDVFIICGPSIANNARCDTMININDEVTANVYFNKSIISQWKEIIRSIRVTLTEASE